MHMSSMEFFSSLVDHHLISLAIIPSLTRDAANMLKAVIPSRGTDVDVHCPSDL